MCGGVRERLCSAVAMKHSERAATSWRQRPDGVQSPVSTSPCSIKGRLSRSTKKYSGRLLMFLLEAHRPQKFGDGGKVEHPGATDVDVDRALEQLVLEKLGRLEKMAALDDEANE